MSYRKLGRTSSQRKALLRDLTTSLIVNGSITTTEPRAKFLLVYYKKGVYNMSIVIGADAAGLRLKEVVKDFLEKENFHVVDVTAEGQDFVDVTLAVAAEVNKEEQNLGIVIDAYGAGPFMVATKIKGMVAAEVSDERSAYMTRGHNNSRMITMGAQLVGDELAKNIAKGFVNGKYDGGRHQIRVDMLNKMC